MMMVMMLECHDDDDNDCDADQAIATMTMLNAYDGCVSQIFVMLNPLMTRLVSCAF